MSRTSRTIFRNSSPRAGGAAGAWAAVLCAAALAGGCDDRRSQAGGTAPGTPGRTAPGPAAPARAGALELAREQVRQYDRRLAETDAALGRTMDALRAVGVTRLDQLNVPRPDARPLVEVLLGQEDRRAQLGVQRDRWAAAADDARLKLDPDADWPADRPVPLPAADATWDAKPAPVRFSREPALLAVAFGRETQRQTALAAQRQAEEDRVAEAAYESRKAEAARQVAAEAKARQDAIDAQARRVRDAAEAVRRQRQQEIDRVAAEARRPPVGLFVCNVRGQDRDATRAAQDRLRQGLSDWRPPGRQVRVLADDGGSDLRVVGDLLALDEADAPAVDARGRPVTGVVVTARVRLDIQSPGGNSMATNVYAGQAGPLERSRRAVAAARLTAVAAAIDAFLHDTATLERLRTAADRPGDPGGRRTSRAQR